MVTWKVADILGLGDRGHLKTGLRADLVRFKVLGADTGPRRGLVEGRARILTASRATPLLRPRRRQHPLALRQRDARL
jgi:cytosine/adenosine deaminase-related metal-dependent hydrolase